MFWYAEGLSATGLSRTAYHKFQAFSFNIVDLGVGELPENFGEPYQQKLHIRFSFTIFR